MFSENDFLRELRRGINEFLADHIPDLRGRDDWSHSEFVQICRLINLTVAERSNTDKNKGSIVGNISVSTMKRFLLKFPNRVTINNGSRDILCYFLGYSNWLDFKQQTEGSLKFISGGVGALVKDACEQIFQAYQSLPYIFFFSDLFEQDLRFRLNGLLRRHFLDGNQLVDSKWNRFLNEGLPQISHYKIENIELLNLQREDVWIETTEKWILRWECKRQGTNWVEEKIVKIQYRLCYDNENFGRINAILEIPDYEERIHRIPTKGRKD